MNEYADVATVAGLPRAAALAATPDGARVVVAVERRDDERARFVSHLWDVSATGGPRQLTGSDAGESRPAFLSDATLLFTSSRPAAGCDDDLDGGRVWALPPDGGEATVFAARPGGVSVAAVARASTTVVLAGSVLGDEEGETERRTERRTRRISGILHSGWPIRYWDHELGPESPRLFVRDGDGGLRDLAPDAGRALLNASCSLSADGSVLATTWREARERGAFPYGVMVIDVASGVRTPLVEPQARRDAVDPQLSPDGARVAVLTVDDGDRATPMSWRLLILPVGDGPRVTVGLGDAFPTSWRWTPDGTHLVVTTDHLGRGRTGIVDAASGAVDTWLADQAPLTGLHVLDDGHTAVALASRWDAPHHPVRLDLSGDGSTLSLPDPAPVPAHPGRLEQIEVAVGDATVHAWLCLPDTDGPAPVMLWIHGGPFTTFNSWAWRWNPWTAVARGWAVVLPDPALSTGYGAGCIARGWPYRADVVWHEAEAVLDAVLARPETDAGRTALLGASFGGYMANWIAGHTDRFGAIVTHAGLWAADQQHTTTDGAAFKTALLGRPADNPEWYASFSPDRFRDRITTPMLVTHGNRDHRVPVSESLRLWWDLVEGWDGPIDAMPHRFLQLPAANHWVLAPSEYEVWWTTVLDFCAHHVLGEDWTPSEFLQT